MKKISLGGPFNLILIIIVVGLIAYFSFYVILLRNVQNPCPPSPFINGDIIKNSDGTYTLTITDTSNSDLNLEEVEVLIFNKNGYVISQERLADLLNNESSNITFYDNDGDYRISVGDSFVFRTIGQDYQVALIANQHIIYRHEFGEGTRV